MAEYVEVAPEESISTAAETMTVESRKEVIVEELVVYKEDGGLQEVSQPVRERDDDDWFLLLDVVPREAPCVPPGTHSLRAPFIGFHTHYHTKEDYLTNSRDVTQTIR